MAYVFAKRIRQNFTSKLSPDVPIVVTISLGVAQYETDDNLEMFTDRADTALYHAKATAEIKL